MDKINKKAQKIRDDRVASASNKNAEAYAFEYINEIGNINNMPVDDNMKLWLKVEAIHSLRDKLKTIDPGRDLKVEAVKQGETDVVQGVLIKWSDFYIKTNQCAPELYIDIGQLLFS